MWLCFTAVTTPPGATAHAALCTPRLLLTCGPPSYRPSAVQSTIFSCQANKWLVSEAVSVYWLLILSLSSGRERSFAFSAALLSDWQSPDFIDFFLHCSLSKYPTADLKDLRHCSTSAATHGFSYNGRLRVLCFFL